MQIFKFPILNSGGRPLQPWSMGDPPPPPPPPPYHGLLVSSFRRDGEPGRHRSNFIRAERGELKRSSAGLYLEALARCVTAKLKIQQRRVLQRRERERERENIPVTMRALR